MPVWAARVGADLAVAGHHFGDVGEGGDDEFAVITDLDGRCGVGHVELVLEVSAAGRDDATTVHGLGRDDGVTERIGGSALTGVDVGPLAGVFDLAGVQPFEDPDTRAGDGCADGVEKLAGVVVEPLGADGDQDGGVDLVGVQAQVGDGCVHGGVRQGGVETADRVDDQLVVVAQEVDDDAVGGDEPE